MWADSVAAKGTFYGSRSVCLIVSHCMGSGLPHGGAALFANTIYVTVGERRKASFSPDFWQRYDSMWYDGLKIRNYLREIKIY